MPGSLCLQDMQLMPMIMQPLWMVFPAPSECAVPAGLQPVHCDIPSGVPDFASHCCYILTY